MPDHLARRIGVHLPLICTQWLALYFLCLHTALSRRAARRRTTLAAALFMVMLALSRQYLLYFALLLTPLYVAGYVWWCGRAALRQAARRRNLLTAALVALPAVAIIEAPYVQLSLSGNGPGHRAIGKVMDHGASPTDFILSFPGQIVRQALTGDRLDALTGPPLAEHMMYLGVTAIVLAGLAFAWRRRPGIPGGAVQLWSALAAVTVILAMGVGLHLHGAAVEVAVPAWPRAWIPYDKTFIPMPGYILYRILPFYGAVHVWTRWTLVTSLFVSLLAAVSGAALLRTLRPGAQKIATVALLAVILGEMWLGFLPLTRVEPRVADRWLAQQPGQGAFVQLPVKQPLMYAHIVSYVSTSNKPFAGSNFGSFWSPQARRLMETLDEFPTGNGIALLRELGVQWIMIDANATPQFDAQRARMEAAGLRFRLEADGTWVYNCQRAEQAAQARNRGTAC